MGHFTLPPEPHLKGSQSLMKKLLLLLPIFLLRQAASSLSPLPRAVPQPLRAGRSPAHLPEEDVPGPGWSPGWHRADRETRAQAQEGPVDLRPLRPPLRHPTGSGPAQTLARGPNTTAVPTAALPPALRLRGGAAGAPAHPRRLARRRRRGG